MVLPRDAPRTGGDVELFPRGRRHGAPADRPARLGHGCVVVFGVFGERGVFGRAERGERGGGAETGGWERVSGASNGGRRPSAPGFPRRGEGRREVVAETAFVCVNSMRIIERNSPLLDATRRDARDGRLVGGRLVGGGSRATTKRTAYVVVVVRVVVVHVVDDDDDERGDEIER